MGKDISRRNFLKLLGGWHAYPHYDCDMGYRRTLRLDKWEITGNRANVIIPI